MTMARGPRGELHFAAVGKSPGRIFYEGSDSYKSLRTKEATLVCQIARHVSMSSASAFGAAAARRDWIAVRARLGMIQESADFLVELGANDVFELAGVRIGF
jgi:hypothetical protein